jgi:hypothetical protein
MNITLEHGALIFLILMITNQLKRVNMSVGQVLEIVPNLHEVSRQFSKNQELGVSLILEPPIINKTKYPPNTGNNHKKETIQRMIVKDGEEEG